MNTCFPLLILTPWAQAGCKLNVNKKSEDGSFLNFVRSNYLLCPVDVFSKMADGFSQHFLFAKTNNCDLVTLFKLTEKACLKNNSK